MITISKQVKGLRKHKQWLLYHLIEAKGIDGSGDSWLYLPRPNNPDFTAHMLHVSIPSLSRQRWAVITELNVRRQSMKQPIWSIPTLWLCSQNRLEQPTYKLGMPFSETYLAIIRTIAHCLQNIPGPDSTLTSDSVPLRKYDGSISPWVKLTEGRPR